MTLAIADMAIVLTLEAVSLPGRGGRGFGVEDAVVVALGDELEVVMRG